MLGDDVEGGVESPTSDRCHCNNECKNLPAYTRKNISARAACMHAKLKARVLRACIVQGYIDK